MTHRQERAIQALLECPTKAQAAQMAGVGTSTLRRWMQSPEFCNAYRQAAQAAMESATRRAQAAMARAVDTLAEIMADGNEAAQARISASRSVLEYALKMGEQIDIMERLDVLEKTLGGDNYA